MENRLRYTGCWPPVAILAEYPNWVFALDEEGKEGQDETTIRPEAQQLYLSEETSFTAAEVRLADGRVRVGIIRLEENVPSALDVFEQDWWSVQQEHGKRWKPVIENWLPENERRLSVSLDDRTLFPLTAKSRLPRNDGKALLLSIHSNGLTELIWR